MERWKSRKFVLGVVATIGGLVLAIGSVALEPSQQPTVERVISALAGVVLSVLASLGYIKTEGKNDALDLLRRIIEAGGNGAVTIAVPPSGNVTTASAPVAVNAEKKSE